MLLFFEKRFVFYKIFIIIVYVYNLYTLIFNNNIIMKQIHYFEKEDFSKILDKIWYFFEWTSGFSFKYLKEDYTRNLDVSWLIKITEKIKTYWESELINFLNHITDWIKRAEWNIETKEFEIAKLKKDIANQNKIFKKVKSCENLEEALIELLK